MSHYSHIVIIFNPNSTGNSQQLAKELKKKLAPEFKGTEIKLYATRYAGHARKLACDAAQKSARPLIISASGDGGYNEVVNGVKDSGNSHAICAVLPAGNANDHGRTMQNSPLHELILKQKITKIDLLRVTVKAPNGKEESRYAHSYVGLGLTPVIAAKVNQGKTHLLREIYILLDTFIKYRPFVIKHEGKKLRIDSILFANINQMAKIFTLSEKNQPRDGKFEIVAFPAGNKPKLFAMVAKASLSNLESRKRADHYEFSTIKKMPMQLDGEVMILPAGSHVSVRSAVHALRTLTDVV